MVSASDIIGVESVNEGTFAPKYSIQVAGQTIDNNIRPFVTQISYESTDGMADMFKLNCYNPKGQITDAKIFQPGNELSLYLGYKEPLKHIGRIIIQKPIANFPQAAIPTLSVVGYTKDSSMDNSPEESKKRRFADYKYSDAVRDVARRYDMEVDVDDTPEKPHNWVQKSGVTDYELVQGMANLSGYVFWVDGDENGVWTLHFRNPSTISEQEKMYTFVYDEHDRGTLSSFRPELLFKGAKTKISVVIKDRKNGKVIKIDVEEENNASPDVEIIGNDATTEVSGGSYTTASDIKLYFGDFSFDTISNKRFKDEEEAKYWAQQWFRRNREDFIMASGRLIGAETLMARQVHKISNTSNLYDGEYYFSKVKHVLDANGYYCDYNCRKQTP